MNWFLRIIDWKVWTMECDCGGILLPWRTTWLNGEMQTVTFYCKKEKKKFSMIQAGSKSSLKD